MQNKQNITDEDAEQDLPLVEGLDFYFEDGLMVLTARYLLNRGYCCGNDCRHCPYEIKKTKSKWHGE